MGGNEQSEQQLPSHPDRELPLQTGPFEADKNWLVFWKGWSPVLSLGSPQPPLAGRGLQYCQKLGAMGPHTCHCSALGSLSPKLTSVHTEQGNYGMGSSKKQGYLGGRRWLSVLYLEAT